jgi:hypothetical protein
VRMCVQIVQECVPGEGGCTVRASLATRPSYAWGCTPCAALSVVVVGTGEWGLQSTSAEQGVEGSAACMTCALTQ